MEPLLKMAHVQFGDAMTSMEPKGDPDPSFEPWSHTATACDPFFQIESPCLSESGPEALKELR